MSSTRKAKRFLSAEQKYDLFVRMLSGQLSQADAAAEAGVDRSTISNLRKTARDGALAGLSARPGRPKQSTAERAEAGELRAELARLQQTIVEQAIELAALRGNATRRAVQSCSYSLPALSAAPPGSELTAANLSARSPVGEESSRQTRR